MRYQLYNFLQRQFPQISGTTNTSWSSSSVSHFSLKMQTSVTVNFTSIYKNMSHEEDMESAVCYMKSHSDTLPSGTPNPWPNWHITWDNPKERQPLIHGQAFFPTAQHNYGYRSCTTICQPFHGSLWRNHPWNLHLGHFLLLLSQLQSLKYFINKLHLNVYVHLWTFYPKDILPRHENPY